MIHSLRLSILLLTAVAWGMPMAFAGEPSLPTGIRGIVLDTPGNPVSGASLRLRGEADAPTLLGHTDTDGIFWLQAEAGRYELLVASPKLAPTLLKIDLSEGETAQIEVILSGYSQALDERVTVLGSPQGLGDLPGSAHYIGSEDLARLKLDVDDIHNLLRRVPGINVQEEDGYGLRPNIGMRGSGTERSAKITTMEDGVLIAPAPYAAPAAYYFPTPGRMEALEVRKGSSQIKHGPRTNGGALNLISTSIPGQFRVNGNTALGMDNIRKLHLNAGNSHKHFGWLVETYQFATDGFKEVDGGGSSGFALHDYMGKFRVNSDPGASMYHQLEVKLGKTEQEADETYLGLTDSDFRADPWRRYASSRNDSITSDHEQYQARYFLAASDRWNLATTVYRNNFGRNWYKLQSIQGQTIGRLFDEPDAYPAELAIARGADSGPDALKLRANNRTYASTGVSTVLAFNLGSGTSRHGFEMGLRYHQDEEDRLQHEDGFQLDASQLVSTSRGLPGSQSNRLSTARAWAFFVQDEYRWKRLTLTPGVRFEQIELTRNDFSTSDPNRNQGPTRVRTNTLGVVVPGLGFHLELTDRWGWFGGVHRGFSPPGPGSAEDTDSEASLNYELGIRRNGPTSASATFFYNDYSNLLGADTLSSGGTGEGDFFNGGAARVYGLELSGSLDLGDYFDSPVGLPAQLSYTFTDAEFRNNFESAFEPWGNVVAGDALPYVPTQQLQAGLGMERNRWRLGLDAYFVDRMRTRAGQGPVADSMATDSYWIANLTGEYRLPGEKKGATLFLTVRNLSDNRYIVARRPAGARPGLPRTVVAGIRFHLGH